MVKQSTVRKFMFMFLFIPFGVTSFITFVYSAKKLNRNELNSYALIYSVCAYSTGLSMYILPEKSILITIIFILNVAIWIESIFHGFTLRKELLNKKEVQYIKINHEYERPKEAFEYLMEVVSLSRKRLLTLEQNINEMPTPIQIEFKKIYMVCH
ncbi:MAG: hypothetical protein ACRCWQ_00590, partial [Bacilli bacterium]